MTRLKLLRSRLGTSASQDPCRLAAIRTVLLVVSTLLALTSCAASAPRISGLPSPAPRISGLPSPAPRIFGLSSPGRDSGLGAAGRTSALIRRKIDVLNFYESWERRGPFPSGYLKTIAATGGTGEITWEPWDPRLGADQPEYRLARIAAGRFDDYIRNWAVAAERYGAPIYLRFAHEMNGTWYPWSIRKNGGSTAAYVAAYRHVWEIFHVAHAFNVRWVWSPNVLEGGPAEAVADSFPGDRYVDVVGVDGYNFGSELAGRSWADPEAIFADTLRLIAVIAPGKTVWINETASVSTGGSKAAWITELFRYLATTSVTGVLWFDIDKNGHQWTIEGKVQTAQAIREALAGW